MADFANRLKQLRLSKGLTQKELGNLLNVSQNAIFNWENNKREPSIEIIEMLADYFNVSKSYLMGWDEETEEQDGYYLDSEAKKAAQFLYENPDYKVLFDASRKVKKEDIDFVKQMIDRMTNRGDD